MAGGKRFAVVAAVLLVLGGVIGFKLYKQAAIRDYLQNAGPPEVHVTGVMARADTWDQRLAAIGSLRARAGIDIRAEVDGVIRAVHVGSRQRVKAGDLLVELDDTVEQATLKSAQARLNKVRRDFERDRSLFARKLISEEKFEATRSEFESAEALVEETQGIIAKKTLRVPFDGTLGIHDLVAGHYLETGDEMMTLQALDGLYLDMNLPEKELERLKPGQRVLFTVPSHGSRQFEGVVRFVDVVVAATTRNVLVRAEVDNPQHLLLPGMFASATVVLDEAREVVFVPREAVAFSLYGETVYLLEQSGGKDWVVRRHVVVSGDVRGDDLAVSGLTPGQIVARDTQHRLLDGAPVAVDNLSTLLLGAQAAADNAAAGYSSSEERSAAGEAAESVAPVDAAESVEALAAGAASEAASEAPDRGREPATDADAADSDTGPSGEQITGDGAAGESSVPSPGAPPADAAEPAVTEPPSAAEPAEGESP